MPSKLGETSTVIHTIYLMIYKYDADMMFGFRGSTATSNAEINISLTFMSYLTKPCSFNGCCIASSFQEFATPFLDVFYSREQ